MVPESKNILFVTPPYHCGVVEVAGSWPPLGLTYLGAQAELAGWQPRIYDAMTLNHDFERVERELASMSFDVFATTAITPTFPDAARLCRLAKKLRPDCVTILGGVHPTFMARDILAEDESIELVRSGNAPREVQDPEAGSYEGWCRKETAEVDWNGTTDEVYNLIRGANPQPGAWTTFDGNEVKLFDRGSYELLEDKPQRLEIRFDGQIIKGRYELICTDEQGDDWTLRRMPAD